MDVRTCIQGLALELLRRCKLRRAVKGAGRRQPHVPGECRDRQSKVADFDRAVTIDKTVRRLDIAVEDARGMHRIEAGDHLQDRIDCLRRWERTVFLDTFFQRAARQQFHHNRRGACDLLAPEDITVCG